MKMGKIKEGFRCYEDAKKELIKNAADKEELAKLYEKWGIVFTGLLILQPLRICIGTQRFFIGIIGTDLTRSVSW